MFQIFECLVFKWLTLVRILNGPVFKWSKNKIAAKSLAYTILCIKWCRLKVLTSFPVRAAPESWSKYTTHSNIGYQKRLDFECFRFSNVLYFDPHCSLNPNMNPSEKWNFTSLVFAYLYRSKTGLQVKRRPKKRLSFRCLGKST